MSLKELVESFLAWLSLSVVLVLSSGILLNAVVSSNVAVSADNSIDVVIYYIFDIPVFV